MSPFGESHRVTGYQPVPSGDPGRRKTFPASSTQFRRWPHLAFGGSPNEAAVARATRSNQTPPTSRCLSRPEPRETRRSETPSCGRELRKPFASIRQARVRFQFPVISAGATYAGKEVLGETDVEPDGSASFEVPAGIPIYFVALDAQGRAVQRMRSFTHLMPGEVQGCVGCHTDRGHSAPRPQRPGSRIPSFKKLQPPDWGVGGFDYATVVQPVLDKHCAQCHSGAAPDGRVDLSGDQTDYFNVSYETLARGRRQWGEAQWDSPFVSWIPSYNGFETNILLVAPRAWGSPRSKLADLLLDHHRDQDGKPRLQMTEAERRRILAWIDLNVPLRHERNHAPRQRDSRPSTPDLGRTLARVPPAGAPRATGAKSTPILDAHHQSAME